MCPAARVPVCLVVAVLAVFPAGRASAQHADALRLEDVVAGTLARNANILGSRQRLVQVRSELLATRGSYDVRLHSSLVGGQDSRHVTGADGSLTSRVTHTNSYQVGASKQFRSGLVLSPQLAVTRSRVADAAAPPTSTAAAEAQLLLPLQGDARALVSAAERAATAFFTAEQFLLAHATAAGVLAAVEAYWSMVAAERRLQVYRESERRAEQLVIDTRALTRAEERPAADTNQVLGNLSTKRLARMAAEQAVAEARRHLGLAMGLDAVTMRALAQPVTPLPAALPFTADTATLARLHDIALAQRADLHAAGEQVRAAQVHHDAARARLRPRLDLALTLGYHGFAAGAGFGQYFEPLYRQVPGVNASMQVTYELPLSNAEARGGELQQASALEQRKIARDHLTSRIISGVDVAAAALERSVAATAEAAAALALYAHAVQAEKEKHRFAAATLIDVILAEDGLTGAMVGQVDAHLSYAVAIARLRFETGTLIAVAPDGTAAVRLETLLTPHR